MNQNQHYDINKVFNLLIHLSGLSNDIDKLIKLIKLKTGHEVSSNQIRNWRRSQNTRLYKRVPGFALDTVFDYMFEVKKKTGSFFEEDH
ncbi:hypothetical protein ACFQ02_03340 [Seminibacterium arietis]|uniref:Uncharacterized protein n=1 Tax=Seminibacterium arietis TaxID=1173502 RepID=A0ABW3I7T6_9PAST